MIETTLDKPSDTATAAVEKNGFTREAHKVTASLSERTRRVIR